MLENTEQSIHENLESNRRRLGAIQHQTGHVEYDARLNHLVVGGGAVWRAGASPW